MQTQPELPKELAGLLATKPKPQKPIVLQGQVKRELKQFVEDALASGITQTQLINTAIAKLFNVKVEVQ